MFKLIALLFLVSNGVTPEKPSGAIARDKAFPTKEACMSFPTSDDGKKERAALDRIIAAQKVKAVVKFACVKIEDNSI